MTAKRKHRFLAALVLSGCNALAVQTVMAAKANETSVSLPWVDTVEATLPALQANEHVFRFIGGGGFYLGGADNAILVDPNYSNPSLWQVISLRHLQTDKALIDRYLPPLDKVQAFLVGHAHYDHAMDVPYIASKAPAEARVYGSETLNNMLAAALPVSRRVSVEPFLAHNAEGGEWINVSPRLRLLAIESEHSPHVGQWVVASGKLHNALQQLPADSLGWVAGTPISYLVDFLDNGGSVNYRVFVQTSSSNPPKGVPPAAILADGHPVNVAVLCAANFDSVMHYPGVLLTSLNPREVVLVHWEKFWEPYLPNKATPLPGLDLETLVQRVKNAAPQAKITLPQRGAQFLLQPYVPAGGNPHAH